MDLSIVLPPDPGPRWDVAKQLGLDTAVTRLPVKEAHEDEKPWEIKPLSRMQERFETAGLDVAVMEERPPMEKTVLGEPGRDEEIEDVKTLLRNLGELDIGVYCWVWTELPLGVLRTDRSVPGRGGSRQTAYDHAEMQAKGKYDADVTEEKLWENLAYFLDRVVPVAEEVGVRMALHPDDPPVSPIRGVPRIVTSVEAYERILDLYPSDHHGITFCQGNFAAMGVDVPEAIRTFGSDIHFVHFRDVDGTDESFVETWHDEGPTDMAAALQAYRDVGFDGPVRPDHVATTVTEFERESRWERGNEGRFHAIGYMQGLLDGLGHRPSA